MTLTINGKGILFAVVGIILLSPDSLLIRLINIDLWTLMFFRGLFMGLCLFAINILLNYGQSFKQFTLLDKYAWGIAVLMLISSLFFVLSIQNTSVAHTLIIVGASPVVAALLGLFFLHEHVSTRTWITILVVVTGLIFVVYDNQQSQVSGDMYALIACLAWSLNIIVARLTTTKNLLAVLCLSGFGMALVSIPNINLSSISTHQVLLCFLLGLFVGIALTLINLAPGYIKAAEVAVFMPLEAVFGSLLVWWFLDEYPGTISFVAGLIIIAAIMLNSYFQITKTSN